MIIKSNQKMASPKFFFMLVISIALPLAVHCSGGFSIDLINRDSPNSPYYNPNLSPVERLRAAAHRSVARANYFRSATTAATSAASPASSFESEVIPNSFEYLMVINVGTPPQKILAIADTGSDLTWAQCNPCVECYKQNAPVFDPEESSTFGNVSCNSDACSYIDQGGCGEGSTCLYQYAYGDQSYTEGVLSSETFTFASDRKRTVSVPKLLFGCSHVTNGTFDENGGGLVGLGGGPLSLVSQLGSSIDRKFSYCLVPFSDPNNSTSLLNFGSKADVGPNAVSTPIATKDIDTFYYLTLEDISVGDEKVVSINKKPNAGGFGGRGDIIIDSGTTLTMLDESDLQPVLDKLSKVVKYPRVRDSDGLFNLCFDVSGADSGKDLNLPDITLTFSGDAAVKLPPLNTFVQPKEGVLCLAIVSTSGLGGLNILGNIAQQNWHIGYDLKARKLSFAPADCAKL